MSKKINIIYIVWAQYSWTTLISNIFWISDKSFNVWEVNRINNILKKVKKTCTCWNHIKDCNFWWSIIKNINLKKLLKLSISTKDKFVLWLYLLFWKIPSKYKNKNIIEDIKLYEDIIEKAKQTKWKQVNYIIEHSKSLKRLIELDINNNDSLDIQVIHPIKDLRAFIYSKNKRWKSILYWFFNWLSINLFINLYLSKFRKWDYIKIKYEDLTYDINKFVDIFNNHYWLDISKENLIHNLNNEPFHVFSGNPMKNKKIEKIQMDDSWKRNLSSFKKWFIKFISWLPNKVLYKN